MPRAVQEKPPFAPAYVRGVAHFNARQFWEAHEAWEELWLVAESDLVEFLQGLIQLAAAYHHVKRGTLRGAVRLFDSSLRRLQPFPLNFCDVDRLRTEESARRHRVWSAAQLEAERPEALPDSEYPRLVLLTTEDGLTPPREPW